MASAHPETLAPWMIPDDKTLYVTVHPVPHHTDPELTARRLMDEYLKNLAKEDNQKLGDEMVHVTPVPYNQQYYYSGYYQPVPLHMSVKYGQPEVLKSSVTDILARTMFYSGRSRGLIDGFL